MVCFTSELEGRSLMPEIIAVTEKPEESKQGNISVGEIAAWMVAALSLCGLIILGMTLFTRTRNQSWMNEGLQNAPSVSRLESDMIPFPKKESSQFYAHLRKPGKTQHLSNKFCKIKGFTEESSVRESVNVDISLDNLYPLKFEDGRSQRGDPDGETFDSVRSCETTYTQISKM